MPLSIFAADQLLHPTSIASALGLVKEEDLVFLGTNNIQSQIRAWRAHARPLATQIKQVAGLMRLAGMDNTSLHMLAGRYRSISFKPEEIIRNGIALAPADPLLLVGQSRAQTTLNNCGWCRYANSRVTQGTATLAGNCSILEEGMVSDHFTRIPEALRSRVWELLSAADLREAERFFFSPCWLWYADKELLDDLAFGLHLTLVSLQDDKEVLDEKLRVLTALKQQAEHKPLLPADRDAEMFNTGMPVMSYQAAPPDNATPQWIPGISHGTDGNFVTCLLEAPMPGNSLVHADFHSPEVITPWDYRYLRANPEYAALWVRGTQSTGQFDSTQILASFIG